MFKKFLFLSFAVGALSFFVGGEASAQCVVPGVAGSNIQMTCESNTTGSLEFGFDPTVSLRAAVENTDASMGPCFTCVTQFKNTAGALTNSMFGVIRENSDADLGDKARTPRMQGQDDIPSLTVNNGDGSNNLGSFTFSLPLPKLNFLNEGTEVMVAAVPAGAPLTRPNPEGGAPFGKAGVDMQFSSTFVFHENGTSAFDQSMQQTTFVGGINGNEFQTVKFDASVGFFDDPATGDRVTDPLSDENNFASTNPGSDTGGVLRWEQAIQEDSFILGKTDGSFRYDSPSLDQGALAIGPSGQGQSLGETP